MTRKPITVRTVLILELSKKNCVPKITLTNLAQKGTCFGLYYPKVKNVQKCVLDACSLRIVQSVPKSKKQKLVCQKKRLAATEDSVFTVPVYQKGGQITLLCNPKGTVNAIQAF
jgi:hypothetical protein